MGLNGINSWFSSKNSLVSISFDKCIVVEFVTAECSPDISDCALGDNGGCVSRFAVGVPWLRFGIRIINGCSFRHWVISC